jgi:MFS family permease
MSEIKKDGFPVKIFICVAVISGLGIMFLTNTSGIFYVTVSEALGVSRSQFSLYYTVQSLTSMVTLLFAGQIVAKYQKKLPLIVALASIGQFSAYFLMSRAQSMVSFYIAALILGFCAAFDTQLLTGVLINNWFRKKTGLIFGITSALTSVCGALITPKLNAIVLSDWRLGYLTVGIGVLASVLPCTFFFKYSPALEGRRAWGELEAPTNTVTTPVANEGVPYNVALKSISFYMCVLMTFFSVAWSCFTFAIPGYVASIGYDGAVVGLCLSCYLVGGVIGKLLGGFLNDVIGTVNSLAVVAAMGTAGMLLLILVAPGSKALLFVGCVLFGVAMGTTGVHPPLITRSCFGNRDYAKIYGNISSVIWIASAVVIPFYNLFYDASGSYVSGMWLAIAAIMLCVVCAIVALRTSKKLERI